MPNRIDTLKNEIDRIQAKYSVLVEKLKETKSKMKRDHSVKNIKSAKKLKLEYEEKANELEAEVEAVIGEVEDAIEEFNEARNE